MVTRWSRISTYRCFHVTCRGIDEAGRLWYIPCGYVPDAQAAQEQAWIFIVLTSISVVYGAFGAIWQKDLKYINAYSSVSHVVWDIRTVDVESDSNGWGYLTDDIAWIDDSTFLCTYWYDIFRTHTRQVFEMGGLMKVIPFLAVVYMIAGFASLGLPGLWFCCRNDNLCWCISACISSIDYNLQSQLLVTAVYILRVVGTLLLGPVKMRLSCS